MTDKSPPTLATLLSDLERNDRAAKDRRDRGDGHEAWAKGYDASAERARAKADLAVHVNAEAWARHTQDQSSKAASAANSHRLAAKEYADATIFEGNAAAIRKKLDKLRRAALPHGEKRPAKVDVYATMANYIDGGNPRFRRRVLIRILADHGNGAVNLSALKPKYYEAIIAAIQMETAS